MTGWEMQGIFISYRRQDSQSAAGRLADHIKEQMPGVLVFRDVETIEPGVDFVEAIDRALQSCGVLLAVIGPHWASVADTAGLRRLDGAQDYTRLEIATALQRPNVRVIPVLVEGAQMPDTNDLPEDLHPLCRRNAIELTDKRWSYDVSQLIETLKKTLGVEPPPPQPEPDPEPRPEPVPTPQAWYRRMTKKQWGIVGAVVVVLAILGEQGRNGMDSTRPPPPMLSSPAGPTAPASPVPGNQSSDHQTPAARPALTGVWQGTEGGRYYLIEQGGQVKFEGLGPHGQVYWGEIVHDKLMLSNTINGTTKFEAMLEISPDGNWLRGHLDSAITGKREVVVLQRMP
jgi:hypothetical protein